MRRVRDRVVRRWWPEQRERTAKVVRDPALALGLVLTLVLAITQRADKNPLNGYRGDDGEAYIRLVKLLPDYFTFHHVTRYTMSRVGAVWAMRLGLDAFRVPLEAPEIISACQTVNGVLVGLTLVVFLSTLHRLRVSVAGRALAVVLALSSFALAKWPYFYAPMTDTLGVLLGAVVVHLYVARARTPLLVVLVAAGFAWPYLVTLMAALFLALPMPRQVVWVEGVPTEPERRPPPPTRLAWLIAASLALLVTWLCLMALRMRMGSAYAWVPGAPATDHFARYRLYDAVLVTWLLPVSIVVTVATVAVGALFVARRLTFVDALASLDVPWALLAFAGMVAIALFVNDWADVRAYSERPLPKTVIQFGMTLQRPGQALVGHFAFFGVATAFALVAFRRFASVVARLGPGYVAVVLLAVVLLALSESRQEAPLLVPLLVPLVKALDERGVDVPTLAFAAGAGAIASKLWFPPMTRFPPNQVWKSQQVFELPLQQYFMHHGITMSHAAYGGHALMLAGALVGAWAVLRRERIA